MLSTTLTYLWGLATEATGMRWRCDEHPPEDPWNWREIDPGDAVEFQGQLSAIDYHCEVCGQPA